MTIKELLLGGGGLLLILMTLVQIAPIKINPWSTLAKAIGKAVNADVTSRLAEIEEKLDGHIKTDDRRTADNLRAQILHFNNELLRPIYHTKEEFIEVLAKIDEYDRYCERNPDYPNNRAVLAIENIREVYMERLKKRDFLQESTPKEEPGTAED
ncbi:hypothetical protein [Dysosmobacter welbionis]|uniref:hypothetical protein n=1 Tax=Dysosmobacter welbionis TaxID=2093857 RepID=UPI00300EF69D